MDDLLKSRIKLILEIAIVLEGDIIAARKAICESDFNDERRKELILNLLDIDHEEISLIKKCALDIKYLTGLTDVQDEDEDEVYKKDIASMLEVYRLLKR